MVTVTDIEEAIRSLPADRLSEFRAWFDEFDADRWDAQIEQDVSAGRLDKLANAALADHRIGRCSEL
jgi:hypothetical protein